MDSYDNLTYSLSSLITSSKIYEILDEHWSEANEKVLSTDPLEREKAARDFGIQEFDGICRNCEHYFNCNMKRKQISDCTFFHGSNVVYC